MAILQESSAECAIETLSQVSWGAGNALADSHFVRGLRSKIILSFSNLPDVQITIPSQKLINIYEILKSQPETQQERTVKLANLNDGKKLFQKNFVVENHFFEEERIPKIKTGLNR